MQQLQKDAPWFTGNYGIELQINLEEANCGSHQGDCSYDIDDLRTIEYIKEQLDALDVENVRLELKQYGAWNETELQDHNENLNRLLWLACGDIVENGI
jgi:hypothetical protein